MLLSGKTSAHFPLRRRLHKNGWQGLAIVRMPRLAPNKSRPLAAPGCHGPLMKPPGSLVQARRLGYRASVGCESWLPRGNGSAGRAMGDWVPVPEP